MAKLDTAFTVATLRDGRMTMAQHFMAGEVGRALAYIEAARATGAELRVHTVTRGDGLGVSDTDAKRLRRAAK